MKQNSTRPNFSNQINASSTNMNNNLKLNQKQSMRKNLFLVAFMMIAVASQAQYAPKNAVKINPLSLFVTTGNISYERAVSQNKSIQLGAYYSGIGLGDFKYQGYGITPEFRVYFGAKSTALNGVYVAPFARYQNFSISDKETKDKATFESIGGGAIMGWQKSWQSGFTLDIFAGPSYSNIQFKDKTQEDDFDVKFGMKGFGLRTGISLGVSF
jgi:hypothetical protein